MPVSAYVDSVPVTTALAAAATAAPATFAAAVVSPAAVAASGAVTVNVNVAVAANGGNHTAGADSGGSALRTLRLPPGEQQRKRTSADMMYAPYGPACSASACPDGVGVKAAREAGGMAAVGHWAGAVCAPSVRGGMGGEEHQLHTILVRRCRRLTCPTAGRLRQQQESAQLRLLSELSAAHTWL